MEVILAVIFLLGVLVYTMIVVRRERKAYKKNARPVQLGPFAFDVPSWWVEKKSSSLNQQVFESTHWKGIFCYFPSLSLSESLEKHLSSMIKRQNIVFDSDGAISNAFSKKKGGIEIVRFEGSGTQNETDRIYFDVYLAWNPKTKEALYGESKSAILHGPLEGPYFEECLHTLRMKGSYSVVIGGEK